MAETLNQVFCIFVRPIYNKNNRKMVLDPTTPIYYISGYNQIKVDADTYISVPVLTQLYSGNDVGDDISPPFINKSMNFKRDAWFLHSTYASYWECRQAVKELMNHFGKDNVQIFIYVPYDYEVTPDE